VVQNADGAIVESNEAAHRIQGLTADQMAGRTSTDPRWQAIHEDGSPFPGRTHPAMVTLATGQPQRDVLMGVRKPDGSLTWVVINSALLPSAGGSPEVVTSFTDVTDRRAIEQQYRMLAENASDVVFRLDADGVIDWVSPNLTALLGWLPQDWVGHNRVEFTHPDDVPADPHAPRTLDSTGRIGGRVRVRTKSGGYRWLDMSLTEVRDAAGRLVTAIGSARDFEDQVRAQTEQRRQAELRTAALDGMLDPLVLLEPVRDAAGAVADFRYVEVNRAATHYLGRSAADLVGMRLSEVMSAAGAAAMIPAYRHTLETRETMVLDGQPLASQVTGTTRHFDMRATAVVDYVAVSWRDVTERVEAATRLAESEQRYRVLAENASDVVVAGDNEGTITWITEGVTDLLGWRPDELVGIPVPELVHPDDRGRVREVQRQLAEGNPGHYEARLQTVAGDYRWVSLVVRPVFDDEGKPAGRIGSWRDIEAEHGAREALAGSEELFRTVMDASAIGMALVNVDGTFMRVNQALCEILGRSRAELMTTTWQQVTHPDDLPVDLALMAELLRGDRDTYRLAKRYLRPDGQVVWGDMSRACRRGDDGQVEYLITQIVDVSEATLAREAALEGEARRKAVVDSLLDPHVLLTAVRDDQGQIVDFEYTDANDAACAYNQMERAKLIGSTLLELLPAHATTGLLDRYIEVVETGEPLVLDDFVYPHEILAEPRRYEIRAVKVGDAMSYTWRDVTDRNQAAAALAAAEERYRMLAENASDVVLMATAEGTITWVTDSVTGLLGWRPADMRGHKPFEYLHPDDIPEVLAKQAALKHGEPMNFEARVRTAGGDYRWVASHVRPVLDATGTVTARVAGWRDVHDQHLATEALAEAEEHFRLLAENATDVVFTADQDRLIMWVSPNVTDTLGWAVDDMVGRVALDFVHPDDARQAAGALQRLYTDRGGTGNSDLRLRWRTRADSYVWMRGRATRVLDDEGRLDYVVAGLSNIDDEVAAREYLHGVLDSALDPHIMYIPITDADGRVVDLEYADVNPAACAYLRITRDAVIGRRLSDRYDSESSAMLLDWCATAFTTDAPVIRDDQSMFSELSDDTAWFDVRAVPVNGRVSLTFRDITARHRVAAQVAASEEKFRLIAENATDAVLHARDGIMVWLSPSLTGLLGWQPEDWMGHRFEEFTHPDDVALAQQRRAEINAGHTRITRLRLRDNRDEYHWVEIHASPFQDARGNPDGIVASFRTIDAQMQAERLLRHRARYDELTGLLNRAEVFERLHTLLSQEPRTGTSIAVAFCDLDSFKEFNDTYGHQMGDHVLKTAAEQIRDLLREDDLIARIGGDELLLVLNGVHDLASAEAVAEKVRHAAAQPHRYLDITYTPKMSIGLTLLRRGEQPDDVIARADRAMYAAKRAGGNRIVAT
jgi:diguanylate cyclase (GGDEF)-like protein/PAS domain S-box-containing protein